MTLPHGFYDWMRLCSCIAFTYFSFRGICAVLYDLCGWFLKKWPPTVEF